jgi:large subunit ribosomal protein L35
MAYKYKPNKAMKKRFRVSGTGKVKHNHSFTSHLRSSRTSKRIRKLRRASVLHEGHARNMREFMGMRGIRPNQIAADRERQQGAQEAASAEQPKGEQPKARTKAKAPKKAVKAKA